MVEDAAKSIEITEEDRMDMEALVEALIEVALAVEEGADPGMAGELVTEFLETNPEIARRRRSNRRCAPRPVRRWWK